MASEVVEARGHGNIIAGHRTTLEFTRERELSLRGDCIVAVSADKGCAGLSEEFKRKLRSDDARLEITIECAGVREKVAARGHRNLLLTHPADMVVRKSEFICPRTLAIKADKAACDLSREFVSVLKEGNPVRITLRVL